MIFSKIIFEFAEKVVMVNALLIIKEDKMSNLKISERALNAAASPIRKLVPLADQAKAKGIKVYHLNIGQPDFKVPQEIKAELQKLVSNLEIIPYSNSRGEKPLREAWIKYYGQNGMEIVDDDLLVTAGGSEAILLVLASLFNPGEEYLVFEPFYANYIGFGNLVSVGLSAVELKAENGYHLPSDEEILAKINSKTKAIFFTNPNNPTGTVFEEAELRRILKIARENNLFIIADETYRGLTFEGKKSVSFLQIADAEDKERIVVVDSLSKRFNICGARLGVIVSKNKEVMDAIFKFTQTRLSVATLEQLMVAPLLNHGEKYVNYVAGEYEKRRNAFLKKLEELLGIKIHYPEGAFYTMLSLPIANTEDFSKWLLTDFNHNGETVMVAPGSGFYATEGKGLDEVRVAYVLNEKELEKAAELLAIAVKEYQALGK